MVHAHTFSKPNEFPLMVHAHCPTRQGFTMTLIASRSFIAR